MRSPLAAAAFCTFLAALVALAANPSAPPAPNPDFQVAQLFRSDTADTTHRDLFAGNRDTAAVKDTTKIIVKRDFVHKEQVVVGSTIMIFVVFILVSMANWNPK